MSDRSRRRCSRRQARASDEDWTWAENPAKQETARGEPPWVAKRRELRRYGPTPCRPRKRLRLDAAEHDPPPAEVQLGLIADDDQLERDDALASDGWLDEQPAIELERERALSPAADRVHLGDDLGPRP